MHQQYIGYRMAVEETLENLDPLPVIEIPISECEGYIAAEDVVSRADSPSLDTSMKDGYAFRAVDFTPGAAGSAARMRIAGSVAAGADSVVVLQPGTALRILTGAPLPSGADTIVAEEFTRLYDGYVEVTHSTEKGRNILCRGSDITCGDVLLKTGQRLAPTRVGLLAAGGISTVRVFPKPYVAIIATGDEVLFPGQPLTAGKLYASNLLTLNGWCRHFGIRTIMDVIADDADILARRLEKAAREQDAILTSGGAWSGDRDLTAHVLNDLGWRKKYHRVRLGPGKAVGFGFLNQKPVFILPGGPPSNLVAFLTLALPGLLKLGGHREPGLPCISAKLAEPVSGLSEWTQAIFGDIQTGDDGVLFKPDVRKGSRLKSMARAQGLLLVPEGTDSIDANKTVSVKVLT